MYTRSVVPMGQPKIDQTQGCGTVLMLGVLASIGWIGYSFWYAPSARERLSPVMRADFATLVAPVDTAEAAVADALAFELPGALFRLEEMKAGNVNIFLSRQQFELLPYPDRDESVQRIGAAWCQKVDRAFAPTVRVRDIRTGETLATFSCLTGRAKLAD